jgi:hypothetical protein
LELVERMLADPEIRTQRAKKRLAVILELARLIQASS